MSTTTSLYPRLTHHAKLRLRQRTQLSDKAILDILLKNQHVGLNLTSRPHRHALFFSEPDNCHFVAIQDESNGDIITILPVNYYENLHTRISIKKLTTAYRKSSTTGSPDKSHNKELFDQPIYCEVTLISYGRSWNQLSTPLGNHRFTSFPTRPQEALQEPHFLKFLHEKIQSCLIAIQSIDSIIFFDKTRGRTFRLSSDQLIPALDNPKTRDQTKIKIKKQYPKIESR